MPADSTDAQALPEPVRARIVALTAQVLPKVTPLPPALKRVADFAPTRRAKLGGTQISLAIGGDDEFRGHVATQAAVILPELATAVREGDVPATADPVDVAALAWLLRPDGWQDLFSGSVARVESKQQAAGQERETGEVERLQAKLADAERTAREQRTRLKEQVDELKAENATLRRKLGDARAAHRTAAEATDQARAEAVAAASAVQVAASATESEVRRLRARITELEASATAVRRDTRAERDDTSLRARLLMDTLLESAQGLRRELALPAVSGAPADRLEAELSEAEPGVRTTSGAGTMGPSSPALLENYLAMPRVRLIIDGYNVSKTAWPESSLEAQRIRLLSGIAALVARSGAETTVVFDAATSENRPPVNPPRGVKVLFSPFGVIADDVIRDLVDAEPQGRMVVVVTSDQEIVRDVRRAGARTAAADALIGVLTR
jgi:predicted RNA-binding protein with PIN domain